jgi:aspartate/methionine/tyrosine aminotransferase
VAGLLGVEAPQGSCFLFLDATPALDERGVLGFLEDCALDGVLVAPGSAAGSAYSNWIRICYTVVPPAAAVEAARLLARRLGRPGA